MSLNTFIVTGELFELCLEIKRDQGLFNELELRKLNVLTNETYDIKFALRYDFHTFPNGSIFRIKYEKGHIPNLQL